MKRISAVLFLITAINSASFADGLILDGVSARTAGRGGTNIASADSGSILHDNVGGAVNFEGNVLFESSINMLFTDVEYQDPDGVGDYLQDAIPLGSATYLRKLNENVAVGVGIYATGGFASRIATQGPAPFTGERTYKSFGAFTRILPGISLKMTDRWSVGATLGVAVGQIELEGPYTMQSGPLLGTPTLMDVQASGAALTYSLGTQYQLSPCTTVGLAYQSETRFRMDGTARTIIPGVGESSFDAELDMVWPRSLGVGLRHQLSQRDVGSIDLIYYNWQKSFDDVGMFMTNATNPIVATFGPLEEQTPLRWRDTLSVRMGYERTLNNCDKIRGGYVYHRNPIPNEYLTPYITPILEHTLSFGYGTRMAGWEVDFGYQYMFGDTQTVGISSIVGGDFNNSETDTTAHLLFLSFQRRQY